MDWALLRGLDDAEQREVVAASTTRRYDRGEVIFHQGDPGDTLHLIAVGRVAVRATTAAGDAVTYAVLGPGEAFGELALLSADARRTSTIVALEPVQTRVLRRDQFETLRQRRPGLDRVLVEVLARRVRRLSAHLVEALYVPVEQRVVRRLIVLCRQYGEDGDTSVTVPLTQTDLAEMAGATRPTVNKVLRSLEAAGVITRARGRIEVLDRHALRRYAG